MQTFYYCSYIKFFFFLHQLLLHFNPRLFKITYQGCYILCPFFSTHSLLVKFSLSPFYQFLIGIQEPPHCPMVHSVFVLAEHIAVLDIVHHCISLDIFPSLDSRTGHDIGSSSINSSTSLFSLLCLSKVHYLWVSLIQSLILFFPSIFITFLWFIESRGFKCHVNNHNFQKTYVSHCFFDMLTLISQRELKVNMP